MIHIGDGNQIYKNLERDECAILSYIFTIPSYLSKVQFQEGQGSDNEDDDTNPPPNFDDLLIVKDPPILTKGRKI